MRAAGGQRARFKSENTLFLPGIGTSFYREGNLPPTALFSQTLSRQAVQLGEAAGRIASELHGEADKTKDRGSMANQSND